MSLEQDPIRAVIAVNPQQMQEAQGQTITWVDQKIAAAEVEYSEAEATINALTSRGMRTAGASNIINRAQKRLKYLGKLKEALLAGYYIIPPFPVQLFAVRTDRAAPTRQRKESRWSLRDESARALPIGDGRYVNPVPLSGVVETQTRKDAADPTKTHKVSIWGNVEFQDEIALPMRAAKPQIIEAVGKALELRIFDALGIAPAYRSADPIIVGQIKRPEGGELTFFVAWWLDRDDL